MKTNHPHVRYKHQRRSFRWKLRPLTALTIISMSSTTQFHHSVPTDTDSEAIGVDNRASACISHKIDDFIDELHDTNRVIIGFNGSRTSNIKTGTLRWNWTDDEGISHSHIIPNSFYCPSGGVRLLSPQHWAQETSKNRRTPNPPSCITTSQYIQLIWGENKYRKTIPLGLKDNVGTMYSSPGYERFHTFCAEADIDHNDIDENITCFECTSILEDEVDDKVIVDSNITIQPHKPKYDAHFTNEDDNNALVSQLELERKLESQSLQLLQYHHRYGHVPFARLKQMASNGIIPHHLKNARTPACTACLYGRATKRKWRHKTPQNQAKIRKITAPGQQVSVDMLYSPNPGFVAQMTGILTRKRYRYATVYVDHFSGFSYLHLQKTQDVQETLQSKTAFEQIAKQHGVAISSYHADNGIFRANKWVQDCINKQQSLTFAGVNAHHQNGRAERRIGLLQELTRTQLIHLSQKWRKIDAIHLWPYAMRMANHNLNNTPNMQHKSKLSALQLFSNSTVDHNPKHQFPFGSPVYVLEQPLQTNLPFNKWKQRSKLGLYLGPSPYHARNISLVLNLGTGLVSPQFHTAHDPHFTTVINDKSNYQWSIKAGLSKPSISTNQTKRPPSNDSKKSTKRSRLKQGTTPNVTTQSPSTTPSTNDPTMDKATTDANTTNPTLDNAASSQQLDSNQQNNIVARRSKRNRKPTERLITAMLTEISLSSEGVIPTEYIHPDDDDIPSEIFAFTSIFPDYVNDATDDLLAMKAASDPDTMYFHEAMRLPDRHKFIEAMQQEIQGNYDNNHF